MDKENNNNIEDILKLLKDTVENSDDSSHEALPEDEASGTEQLNAELLKEKLREQFMLSDEKEEKSNDEYTIDNDLISEFYEESEKALEATEVLEEEIIAPEEENQDVQTVEQSDHEDLDAASDISDGEDLSAHEGEIVEIVIPWVGAIEESSTELEEENDDFGGEPDDELYDGDNSESSYICFADETVSDEDILADEEEVFSEESGLDDEQEASLDDDDDLPWIEDEASAPLTTIKIEEIVEQPQFYQDDILEEDEKLLAQVAEEPFAQEENDAIEEVYDEETVIEEQVNDQVPQDIAPQKIDKADDEEEISFYRTMVEARDELEMTYGYPRTSGGDEDNSEYQDSNDEIELPHFDAAQYSLLADATVSADDTKNDFYDVDEHDTTVEENRAYTDEQVTDEMDFEDEDAELGDISEKLAGGVWRIIKPILLGILALALLVFEMLPVIGVVPDGILDYTSYPWTYILIDTQLLIFSVALGYEKMFDGLCKTITPEANFYSLLSVGAIVAFVNNLLSCFFANDATPKLYSFIIAAYIFALCIAEKENAKRIKESVGSIEMQEVFSLKRSQGKNSCAEKMYSGGVNPDTSILEPVEIKLDSIEAAFVREKAGGSKNFYNSIVFSSVIPAVIFAIFMAVIVTALDFGFAASLNAFAFAFVSLAPLSAIISYYLPIFISHHRLRDRGCYITGYDGAYEMSDCDAVVFNDCHLFKPCSAKEAGIKLYCSESKTRELFVALAAVYSKIGGPMKDTFSSVLGDEPHNVNMIRITRNGFEAVVDGKVSLIVGGSDYLARYGIVTDRSDSKDPGVIFAALNSVLSAKISIKYRTQPLFEELCAMLDANGTRCVIETYDPVISGRYVARCRELTESSVSVVHKNANDYNMPRKDKVSMGKLGAFATASRLKLVELVIFCKRLIGIRKINTAIHIASYVVVAAASILLAASGAIGRVNLLWALLYHLLLIAIYVVATIKFLPLSFDAAQDKKEREENKKQEKENRN